MGLVTPLPMAYVPEHLACPDCGKILRKNLALFSRFEVLVERALFAERAPEKTPGYDVFNSQRFPDLTFQVKVSSEGKAYERRKINRTYLDTPCWTFNQANATQGADWYICFGIKEDGAYPFAFPKTYWEERGSRAGKQRLVTIKTHRLSRLSGFQNPNGNGMYQIGQMGYSECYAAIQATNWFQLK